MSAPRILLDLLGFERNDGGFASTSMDMVRCCARLSEFEFLIVTRKGQKQYLEPLGIAVLEHRFPRQSRFLIGGAMLPRLARKYRAAAVHSEITAAPRWCGIPTSMALHDLDFRDNRTSHDRGFGGAMMHWYFNGIFVRALKRATLIKALSHTTARHLQEQLGRTDGVVVIPPFFERGPPREKDARLDVLRIVFVGSIVPRKNLALLLDALRSVKRPWRLDIVGRIAWDAHLLAPFKGDSRVIVHGFQPDEARNRIVASAHVSIMPSTAEGFGYPVLESVALGTPALVSDIDIFGEYAPDDARFPLGAPDMLAARLDRLDAASLAKLQGDWDAVLARYSFELAVERYRGFFDRLLAARKI